MLLLLLLCVPATQTLAAGKSQLIYKVHTTSKVIALTFDDGYGEKNVQKILDILIENHVKATFFLVGSAAKAYPDLVESILENGNVIGNHSYSHPCFTDLSAEQMKEEVNKTDAIIKKMTGQSTKPLFRPPYGDYNSSVLEAMGEAGYTRTITWTIDTLDWKGISADKITKEVLSKASPGFIVLMHAGSGAKNTPAALPGIIKGLRKMGYQFVTIPELLSYSEARDELNNDDIENDVIDNDARDYDRIDNENPNGGNRYIVEAGDTLTGIAKEFGVTIGQIVSANHIENPNLIYVDQVLIIPGRKPVTAVPAVSLNCSDQ